MLKAIREFFTYQPPPEQNPVGSKITHLGVEWTIKQKVRGVDMMHPSYDVIERINPHGAYEETRIPK